MILTKASDCSSFTVTSDYFTQGAAGNWESFKLYVKKCDVSDWTFVKDFVHGTATQDVTAADLGYTIKIPDGVYCFKLLSDEDIQAGPNTYLEYGSIFFGCDMKCTIAEKIAGDYDSELPKIFTAVEYAAECSDCECDKPCTIYEYLLALLKQPSNPCKTC